MLDNILPSKCATPLSKSVSLPTDDNSFSESEDDDGTDIADLELELRCDPEYLSWLEDPWPAWVHLDDKLPAPLAYRQWMHQRGQCELTGLPMVMSARSSMYAPSLVARDRTLPLSYRLAAGRADELSMYNFCFVLGYVSAMVEAAAQHGCTTLAGFVRLTSIISLRET